VRQARTEARAEAEAAAAAQFAAVLARERAEVDKRVRSLVQHVQHLAPPESACTESLIPME
jgi:iron-sulfur cluster repair protein YtfE (RIC family)